MTKAEVRDHVGDVIARFFPNSDHGLRMSGVDIEQLASQHKTPFYVYDSSILGHRLAELKSAIGDEFHIHYSVKANPNQRILRFFLDKGCGLEIASAGELHQALVAGCPAERILFAGPGKTDRELELALEVGVGEIHVESTNEARRLSRLANERGQNARIAVRVNPSASVQGGAMRMGGKPTQFGIDEEQLPAAIEEMTSLPGIDICGIHLFHGTQILDTEILLAQYRHAVILAAQMAESLRHPLVTIDFGGGLGIPYFPHESELDVDALRAGIVSIIAQVREHPLLKNSRLVVEPGRFLTADAGVYVTRVIDTKESRGKRFVVVDGGMHHHLAASGNLGQTIKRNFPVAVLNRLQASDRPTEKVELVGALCTPLDHLGRAISLPRIEVGDLVGIFRSGAYARTASPHGFLSHPTAAEIWIDEGKTEVIRRRGETEDYLLDQCGVTIG